MATIRVQTTQNVTVEYEVAGLGERLLATIIDYLLYFAWAMGWIILSGTMSLHFSGLTFFFLIGLPILLYYPLCEILFDGQTIGKRARRIRVIRLDGTAPRIGDYLLRWLLLVADNMFYLGLIVLIFSERGQRMGDLAAGTTVVKLRATTLQDGSFDLSHDPATYVVTFPEAALLTDRDASLVRRLLQEGLQRNDQGLLHDTARRVRELTGIPQPALDHAVFLRLVLADHAHLASSAE